MKQSRIVFQTEWFSIEQESFDNIEFLKGKPYYRINSPDGVMILAVTEKTEIVLVKQFRPSQNQYTLEFPSGAIAKSESLHEAAARELYEETVFVCKELHSLGSGRVLMNRQNSTNFAFYGRGAVQKPGYQACDNVEVVLASPAEFKKFVLSGEFEQFPAFAPIVLAAWKYGDNILTSL